MSIWAKYLFGQLVKTFFFLLFCLFGLYMIVDLSVHGLRFFSKSAFLDVALYYLHTFATLLELFLSLTFLLTALRVLSDLNGHKELLALQIAGFSKKRLLTPFFLFAAFLSCLCYFNSQWIAPQAQEYTDFFKDAHRTKKKKVKNNHVFSLPLQDGSTLVYQTFDPRKKEVHDVFWIQKPNDIWHMKSFEIASLCGIDVDHFRRDHSKKLEKIETLPFRRFPEIQWSEGAILQQFAPFQSWPISILFFQALANSSEKAGMISHLFYKLLTPLIPFLILLAIAPVSLRFSRNQPLFLIASASIFAFIGLKVILDGMLILGENQVLPAPLAILSPIALVLAFSLPPFVKMR